MVGFRESFLAIRLNGAAAERISAAFTSAGIDLTQASGLKENAEVAFMGDTKGGAFDIPGDLARESLRLPPNPNGRPNSDVLKLWRKAVDVTRRLVDKWIIDFGWTRIEPEVVPGYPDRILPKDAEAAKTLKTRTLTNLYNERPAWLDAIHRRLDAAVAEAYGWPTDLSDAEILARLFALNQARAAAGR